MCHLLVIVSFYCGPLLQPYIFEGVLSYSLVGGSAYSRFFPLWIHLPCALRALHSHTLTMLCHITPPQKGLTPLHRAADNGHTAVVADLLADPRVEVDAKNFVSWGQRRAGQVRGGKWNSGAPPRDPGAPARPLSGLECPAWCAGSRHARPSGLLLEALRWGQLAQLFWLNAIASFNCGLFVNALSYGRVWGTKFARSCTL